MSPLSENGFLSTEIISSVAKFRAEQAEWFEVCLNVNRCSHRIVAGLHVDRHDPRQTFGSLFFVRALDHFQGAVLMAERGMAAQADTLCRGVLEALFTLSAIRSDGSVVTKLIRGDRRHQLRMLEKARELGKDPNTASDAAANLSLVEAEIDRLKRALKDDPGEPPSIKELATAGGLVPLYRSAYSILSLTVHSNLRDLERQLALDSDGNISGLFWGPDPRRIDEILFTVSEAQIMCCEAILAVFAGRIRSCRTSAATPSPIEAPPCTSAQRHRHLTNPYEAFTCQ